MSNIKSFLEYSELSSRTVNYIICDTKEKQLMHYALGLIGEFGGEVNLLVGPEIDVKEMSKELGDCFWYFSRLIAELGVELNPEAVEDLDAYCDSFEKYNRTVEESHKDCLILIAQLTEYVKKVCCFNHPRDSYKERKLCKSAFIFFIDFVNQLGLTPSVIMFDNIEKLKARYPDGFSTEASFNRKDKE